MATNDRDRANALLRKLDARATGFWRVDGLELVQTAFVAALGMPGEVAEGFAAATLRVPLDQVDLGIVKAALEKGVAVSRIEALSEAAGSGRWLRAFGADRSVAVALIGAGGDVFAVFSAALKGREPADDEVVRLIRDLAGAGPDGRSEAAPLDGRP